MTGILTQEPRRTLPIRAHGILSRTDSWAILPSALQGLLAGEWAGGEGTRLLSASFPEGDSGIAVISITGPLFRYENIFTHLGRASSYERIRQELRAALENPQVKTILLKCDSPGGEVNGVSEVANLIYGARGHKPLIAYASGTAASGAYWIASAADKIVVSETAALGSIGVVGVYYGNAKDEGVVEIVSSQSPYKALDPASSDGKARLQTRIDTLAAVFVKAVARHRAVSCDVVLSDYGGGDVLIGEGAVRSGLADHIGSFENLLTPSRREGVCVSCEFTRKESQPMDVDQLKNEFPDLVKKLHTEGAQEERKRLEAVLSCDAAQGREKLALEIALRTTISAEEALCLLQASPHQMPSRKPSSFERMMDTLPNPEIAPDGEQIESDVLAQRIAAAGS